jgi:hypothetical protein
VERGHLLQLIPDRPFAHELCTIAGKADEFSDFGQ